MKGKDTDVLVGDKDFKEKVKPPNSWDEDFGAPSFSDLDKILEVPGLKNIGGNTARWNIRDDEDRKAYLMTIYNCINLGMEEELVFVLICGESTLGLKAFGKSLQLQSHIGMAMPQFMAQQLGIAFKGEKNRKSDFERSSRSDFAEREEYTEREPRR